MEPLDREYAVGPPRGRRGAWGGPALPRLAPGFPFSLSFP